MIKHTVSVDSITKKIDLDLLNEKPCWWTWSRLHEKTYPIIQYNTITKKYDDIALGEQNESTSI